MAGAIVVAEPGRRGANDEPGGRTRASLIERRQDFLAGVELLGRSAFARLLDTLRQANMDVSVAVDSSLSAHFFDKVLDPANVTANVWRHAAEQLSALKGKGVELVLIARANAYVEFDPSELMQFHRERNEVITRARDNSGPLDLWVVNSDILAGDDDLLSVLEAMEGPYYWIPGYVKRLETLSDMHVLVTDALNSRSQFRPVGLEVRPGVWMGEGAQVEREARVVAPAYIGRHAKVCEQCLITRGTSIESDAHIDYGTAVESSLILSGTYVGIGLDLSHAIADGHCLMSLNRRVMLEIKDPVVLRQTKPRGEAIHSLRSDLAVAR